MILSAEINEDLDYIPEYLEKDKSKSTRMQRDEAARERRHKTKEVVVTRTQNEWAKAHRAKKKK